MAKHRTPFRSTSSKHQPNIHFCAGFAPEFAEKELFSFGKLRRFSIWEAPVCLRNLQRVWRDSIFVCALTNVRELAGNSRFSSRTNTTAEEISKGASNFLKMGFSAKSQAAARLVGAFRSLSIYSSRLFPGMIVVSSQQFRGSSASPGFCD